MREYRFPMLNRPIDVSEAFRQLGNTLFAADRVVAFNAREGRGTIRWKRYERKLRLAFGEVTAPYEEVRAWEFPGGVYPEEPELPFSIEFIDPRTIRLRVFARAKFTGDEPSLMLVKEPVPAPGAWSVEEGREEAVYRSEHGTVRVCFDPFRIVLEDPKGRLITRTLHMRDSRRALLNSDATPFSFVRLSGDMSRRIAASFELAYDEKLFGCGESFSRLNKRGQRVIAMTNDAHGSQTGEMYKPIPFFLSSRGYGMFVHTSVPVTFDFGYSSDQANVIYLGDPFLDLFIFLGEPKEVLEAYTALTGRSPVPPLWSFGFWMSRITYQSEDEVRNVAKALREHKVPCDVIHIDTGWFERDWCCDYRFSKSRFRDPAKMIEDLRKQGFRISLWQLPYFTPINDLYREAVEKGYVVRGPGGEPATEDAVIDFSNPEAVKWYQGLLAGLLKLGVGAIKVDFGEAAPLHGLYASGKTGYYEHNLYPLRYNKAAFEVTQEVTGESIIWARSAWAGSQRYPVHWGGDAETSDAGMAASLRAGLSFGLSGFTYWSHDIGGFVMRPPAGLYKRWAAFGMLTSHSRAHGSPPREPWEYGEDVLDSFRRSVELKYRLMPYVYAQAVASSRRGHPMMRTLFFEYPQDPTSWFIEDEYFFGEDLLVAPLFEDAPGRSVYLPPGRWMDYQSGRTYEGARWHDVEAGPIPIVLMARVGSVIPHIRLAQCTDEMDWSEIELVVMGGEAAEASGLVALPGAESPARVRLVRGDQGFRIVEDPFAGRVQWKVTVR